LSGTGSSGATVRIYFEKYEADKSKLDLKTEDALKELIAYGLNLS
jgi:phosphoglucomutase